MNTAEELTIETAPIFEPLLHPSRYKGAHGGRGSGKSHFFAESMIERHLMGETHSVCLREKLKSLEFSVKKLIENKIEQMGVGHLFEVQDKRIKDSNGGRIIFEGMQNHTAESIKSLEGFDIAWFEEAQTASQVSLDLLRPTIRKENSELWFSWNPKSPDDPIDALLRGDSQPPDSIVVEANYHDNPWLPQVLVDELEYDRSRDMEKFNHIWLGQYLERIESRVFKNYVVEEFERPPGTVYRFGADWGFSVDPSCLVRCSVEGNRLYIDYEAYMIGREIVNLPDLFRRVPESDKWFITADSARPETISHMQQNGFPKMNKAIKGPGSIDEGIAFLQSFDIIVHPRCKHVIDELNCYSYKRDKLTDEILPILEDKNNHLIDALRYGCEGIRQASKKKRVIKLPKLQKRMPSSTGWMS